MSWGMVAVAGATLVGGVMNANSSKKAANQAADAQREASQLGIEENRRQYDLSRQDMLTAQDQFRQLLSPYVNAGGAALTGQQNLLGLNGAGAQDVAYREIASSPAFQAITQQGEDAILANASATGGLRGGNVQGALAQFRPNVLAQLIDQQYSRLGGLATMGQNSAVGVGTAGLNTGGMLAQLGGQNAMNISNLLGQQGAASAGAALAAGRARNEMTNSAVNAFGQFMGAKF